MTLKNSNDKNAQIIVETISSFYDKLNQNDIKKVTIMSDSIRYKDLSEKIYQAILPKAFHTVLEEKLM